MKALLLSVSAGQGHHQCAMALMDYLQQNGVKCEMIDTLGYINSLFGKSVEQGYLLSTQLVPTAYGKGYRLAEKRKPESKLNFSHAASAVLSSRIKKYLRENQPDVIICTHVFAAQIVSDLKVDIPTIGIVTDFTIHPFWEETNMHRYVLASELLFHQAAQKHLAPEKLMPIGIPINPKFAKRKDKKQARAQLGLEDKTTIFLMGGSMGYGNLAKQIKQLDKLSLDFQILCVCGRNEKLKQNIDRMALQKTIYNFGYVNNVDVMMDAADVMITKPGGLTVSEALAKQLPLILMNPIPGQEERNAEFLLNNGAGMMISPTFPADECLYQLLMSDRRLAQMEAALQTLAKPNAVQELGDFILGLANKHC